MLFFYVVSSFRRFVILSFCFALETRRGHRRPRAAMENTRRGRTHMRGWRAGLEDVRNINSIAAVAKSDWPRGREQQPQLETSVSLGLKVSKRKYQ